MKRLNFLNHYWVILISLFINSNLSALDADSLHYKLRNATDTTKVDVLLHLAEFHMFKYPDSTIYFGEKALQESEKLGFPSWIARSNMKIADGHYFKNEFLSSIDFLSRSAEIFREVNDLTNYAECLNRVGVNYNRIGNYSQAKAFSSRALEIYRNKNDFQGQWKCVSNLGIVAKEIGDLDKSLEYHFESLKIAERLKDPSIKSRVLTNIGNTYVELDEIEESLKHYHLALQIADSLVNKKSMAMLRNNIATCYEMQEDYDKAEAYYQSSLELKKELGDFLGAAVTLNNLGFNYIDKKNFDAALASFEEALKQPDITDITRSNCYLGLSKIALIKSDPQNAEKYALKSHDLIKNIDNMPQKRRIAETLYEIYESNGDHKNALEFLKLYHTYSDSLVNKEKLMEIGRLEAQHDFDLKEQQLVTEQIQRDLESERQISEQKRITYLVVAAFLMLLIVSFLIYHSHRQKHRANLLLKEKNKEIQHQKEKMELQADKLSQLNELKDRLFSIISHDLRNPLNSVKLLLDMALKQDFTIDDFKKFLPIASKDVNYTLGLLNNLLHWSNSQMKGEIINKINFVLAEVAQDAATLYERQAMQKNIRIRNMVDKDVQVYGDKNMTELVLRNLVSNAVKFCNVEDEILITASEKDQEIEVCVADTGIGISQEHMNKLFRNENFTTRGTGNEKGTGLGLLLCKEFVEKNGGIIRVESTPGKGSRIYFTLPVAVEVEEYKMLSEVKNQ